MDQNLFKTILYMNKNIKGYLVTCYTTSQPFKNGSVWSKVRLRNSKSSKNKIRDMERNFLVKFRCRRF